MLRVLLAAFAALLLHGLEAAATTLLAPGQPLDRATVEAMILEGLADQGLEEPLALRVERPELPMANRAGLPITLALRRLVHDPATARYEADIEATLEGGASRTITVAGTVEALVEVPVPRVPIAQGEIISAEVLQMRRVPASALRADQIRAMASAVGMEALRPLAAGRLLRTRDVAEPALIKRGDAVRLVYARGGLEVTASGQALELGRQGQSIRVSNDASGEVRRGTVVGPRRVLVSPAGVP